MNAEQQLADEIVASLKLKDQIAALSNQNEQLRKALTAIRDECAAPALEMHQRDAVHFAYNTAVSALALSRGGKT